TLDLSEDGLRVLASGPRRAAQGKPAEKNPDTFRRIFSAHKKLYTVVQHVKHFNDVVEFGENQEFTDDFEYLTTGLKSGQPLNTRCLR
ncbi:hypothetical protein GOODEAATRI_005451, partial [Goodea atripinnis]